MQNAIEASRGAPAAVVRITVATPRAGAVDVTVEDNGPGIAEDIAERLFEPYATTKAEGTGLGLAIAQRIALEHDGELALIPREDETRTGAVFRLRLPVVGPP